MIGIIVAFLVGFMLCAFNARALVKENIELKKRLGIDDGKKTQKKSKKQLKTQAGKTNVQDEIAKLRKIGSTNRKNSASTYSNVHEWSETDEKDESLFDEFKDNLSIVWADAPILIEFNYNSSGDKIMVSLEEVSINSAGEPYFFGYCIEVNGDRTFKVERIASRIQYAGKEYSKQEFFDDVLQLNSGELL
ncbi:exported hypothetical protein [Xenorhabdus bovienii str. oregonense]|uniref:WYL domain-containing protein n=1 Tax=Xenorhabdus bovienii str. oregonense TaxID=1398202 RepID=A0A077PA14_XENBV|nr:hypothetical protein [Xenorhabdus bovienii]CDH06576.1 exported hypothetical protein [Xenorhabdus bovienii str. oregonense]